MGQVIYTSGGSSSCHEVYNISKKDVILAMDCFEKAGWALMAGVVVTSGRCVLLHTKWREILEHAGVSAFNAEHVARGWGEFASVDKPHRQHLVKHLVRVMDRRLTVVICGAVNIAEHRRIIAPKVGVFHPFATHYAWLVRTVFELVQATLPKYGHSNNTLISPITPIDATWTSVLHAHVDYICNTAPIIEKAMVSVDIEEWPVMQAARWLAMEATERHCAGIRHGHPVSFARLAGLRRVPIQGGYYSEEQLAVLAARFIESRKGKKE